MEQIRSFVAIELPPEIKAGLKRIQDSLSSAGGNWIKWVEPGNVHLTLKFLGNVAEDKLAAVSQALQDSADHTSAFQLNFKGLGAFPNLKRVQVVWIGLGGQLDVLQAFFRAVEENLEILGFPPEGRPFTPHLTLARVRESASLLEKQNLGKLIDQTKLDCELNLQVDSISLMKSQLTRAGAVYSCLKSVRLK
jgi:RNA 2',3'-cyclic 3'-phosphodiesterase